MKVLVVVDGHLVRTQDGRVWSARIYNYDFFARYLSAFDEVRVAMRIKDVKNNEGYPNLCSGENIEFWPIDDFKGPKEYLTKFIKIRRKIKQYFDGCDCGIFRIPSTVGYQFLHAFQKTGKPYSIEVVVDPWDFAAPGTLKTPLRPIIRYYWTNSLKRDCLKANGVSYVTKFALQKRYPSYAKMHGKDKLHFEEYYSSVNISESYFSGPKDYQYIHHPIRIVHVTNFIGNHVKGHEELIEAVSKLKEKGIHVEVDFVGEGTLIEEFRQYAFNHGVGEQIHFIGKIATSQEIRKKLQESDVFVFPSHAEGLPRVLIEAMAVGLPAVSTNVNGIPELLSEDFLVEVGDVEELTRKIEAIVTNPKVYNKASKDNLNRARGYSEPILQSRRKDFYQKLELICENQTDILHRK